MFIVLHFTYSRFVIFFFSSYSIVLFVIAAVADAAATAVAAIIIVLFFFPSFFPRIFFRSFIYDFTHTIYNTYSVKTIMWAECSSGLNAERHANIMHLVLAKFLACFLILSFSYIL